MMTSGETPKLHSTAFDVVRAATTSCDWHTEAREIKERLKIEPSACKSDFHYYTSPCTEALRHLTLESNSWQAIQEIC